MDRLDPEQHHDLALYQERRWNVAEYFAFFRPEGAEKFTVSISTYVDAGYCLDRYLAKEPN